VRPCAIIPSYRHAAALPALIEALRLEFEAIFIVDDGNEEPLHSAIAALHAPERSVEVFRHEQNLGKGAAVITGFRAAIARGFTHALQIDADGQHDVADVPKFLTAGRAAPKAVICGKAVYDQSVPAARKFGRYITHFWVWVETFSFDISDSMCGFRLYPLDAVARLIDRAHIGAHMDFDIEIVVRLHWLGAPIVNIPTRVIYPPGNVSNFAMLTDNVRISLMHTQLALQAPFRVLWKLVAARS